MLKENDQWRVKAAGPTTSIREEPYEADIIRRFGLRAVMGKGGMGAKTGAALKEYGAVYLHAIGGAAQFYARCLPKVHGVYLLEELGVPEAMWVFEARNFPAIVTMDSHGNSLHAEVAAATGAELEKVGKAVAALPRPSSYFVREPCTGTLFTGTWQSFPSYPRRRFAVIRIARPKVLPL